VKSTGGKEVKRTGEKLKEKFFPELEVREGWRERVSFSLSFGFFSEPKG